MRGLIAIVVAVGSLTATATASAALTITFEDGVLRVDGDLTARSIAVGCAAGKTAVNDEVVLLPAGVDCGAVQSLQIGSAADGGTIDLGQVATAALDGAMRRPQSHATRPSYSDEGSLRPCLAPPIAPRQRGLITLGALSPRLQPA